MELGKSPIYDTNKLSNESIFGDFYILRKLDFGFISKEYT